MAKSSAGAAFFHAQGQREAARGYPITYMRESRQWLPQWARAAHARGFWCQSAYGFSTKLKPRLNTRAANE